MENIDIIILSVTISILFFIFFILLYKESKNIKDQSSNLYETSPRANMIRLFGSLFDSESAIKMTKKEKIEIYNVFKNSISDMESDGVYFPEHIKQELENKRKINKNNI